MSENPFGNQIFSFSEWRKWEAKWASWLGSNVLQIGPVTTSPDRSVSEQPPEIES